VLYFAGGDTWDIPVTFRCRQNGPTGPQIGPAKIGRGAYQAVSNGFVAVSWNPGEVPLVPGTLYYLEADSGAHGFNPAKFSTSMNAYAPGQAYQSYGAQPGVDLLMQVVEYATVEDPTIDLDPTSFYREVVYGHSPSSDTFDVSNSGGGFMSYSITDNASWLAENPTSGTCTTETDPITVSYSTASLGIGPHNATITVSAPGATNTPQAIPVQVRVLAPGDMDGDNDVDQEDFGPFQACYSGQGITQNDPDCWNALLDLDDDVDLDDFTLFQGCVSGKGVPVDPQCVN
jgi:hypothetical protein